MLIAIETLISIVCALCTLVSLLIIIRRNGKTDDRETGIIASDIGYMKSGIDDIKREHKAHNEILFEISGVVKVHETRISALERGNRHA